MENNFNQEFQEKVDKSFEIFKNSMNGIALAMSNLSNIIKSNLAKEQTLLNCVERIKKHYDCFDAKTFDKTLIIDRLLLAASQSLEPFSEAIINETEKIIQEINYKLEPKTPSVNKIIFDDHLCPKIKPKKNKKPFYKKLDRLKKWEQ